MPLDLVEKFGLDALHDVWRDAVDLECEKYSGHDGLPVVDGSSNKDSVYNITNDLFCQYKKDANDQCLCFHKLVYESTDDNWSEMGIKNKETKRVGCPTLFVPETSEDVSPP